MKFAGVRESQDIGDFADSHLRITQVLFRQPPPHTAEQLRVGCATLLQFSLESSGSYAKVARNGNQLHIAFQHGVAKRNPGAIDQSAPSGISGKHSIPKVEEQLQQLRIRALQGSGQYGLVKNQLVGRPGKANRRPEQPPVFGHILRGWVLKMNLPMPVSIPVQQVTDFRNAQQGHFAIVTARGD
jgi:hypothetical protein